MKKIVYTLICCFILLTGSTSCMEEEGDPANPVLSESSITLDIGETESVYITGGMPPYSAHSNSTSISTRVVTGTFYILEITGKSKTGNTPATVTVQGSDGGQTSLSVVVR